jgi:hypothetical protein
MRLELIPCPTCGDVNDEAFCPTCCGSGCVPIDLDEPGERCRCCGQSAEVLDTSGVCDACNEPAVAEELLAFGVPVTNPAVDVPWMSRIPF